MIFRSLLRVFAEFGAVGALLGVLLGLLQNFHPAFDSFSHFRLHFVVLLIVCCMVLVFVSTGKTRWLAVMLGVIGAGWLIAEFQKGPPETSARGDIRLIQFNLNFRNRMMDRVGQELTAYDADVVLLQEVPPQHEAFLRTLSHYPHQAHCFFRHYVGGVSILSKHPLSAIDCASGEGVVTALAEFPSGAATVGSIHTLWPWPIGQHEQIDKWAPRLRTIWGPTIIAGDFNAAAWSHAVAKVEEASRTKTVPGVRMTIDLKVFPLLPAVPIPIDHALLSEEFCVTSARVGEALGSDHYPVVYEIVRVGSATIEECTGLPR